MSYSSHSASQHFARKNNFIIDRSISSPSSHLCENAYVGVFGPRTSKFVFACLARMVCSKDTRVYTGSGGMSLHPVHCYSCYRHLVCNRGYKQAREGKDPKSLVKGVNGC